MKCGWLSELEKKIHYLQINFSGLYVSYTLTGCDTVSEFFWKTVSSTWNSFSKTYRCTAWTGIYTHEVTEQIMKVIERFIVLLSMTEYRCGQCYEEDVCHNLISAKYSPNTYCSGAAGSFSRGHIWGQAPFHSHLPSPCSWGWLQTNDGLYEPFWTTLQEASKSCYELYNNIW